MKIFKKSLIVLFISIITIFTFSFKFNFNTLSSYNDDDLKVPLFSNNNFDTTLSDPNVIVEDFISFSDIYTIIDAEISSSQPNDSSAIITNRDNNIVSSINSLVGNKRVVIETPDELFQFSNTQSFNYKYQSSVNRIPYENTIKKILSLDYVLLNDIDYSEMRAKKFVPIGTNINIELDNPIVHYYPFTGSFDGNGYKISNLYLADYSYITTTIRFDDDITTDTDFALFKYYSMFSIIGDTGVVKNLIIKDPIYELLDAPVGLTKTSMFVGENYGTIYNVSVIDQKKTKQGLDNAGIRFNIQYSTNELFTASGFAHYNNGTILNSFLVSEHVLVAGSRFRFNTKPFIYENEGTLTGNSYDISIHPTTDDITSINGVTSYTENELKTGLSNSNPIVINDGNTGDDLYWEYYQLDGFPELINLEFDSINNEYIIYDEYDFVNFMRLINFNTPKNGKTFDLHKYRLENDINLFNIKNIKTSTKDFKGTLYGGDDDFTNLSTTNNNKYIYNLTLNKPFISGSNYYLALFNELSGTVNNINFYNNKINVTNSKSHYGKTFYVGMIAGNLKGTVKNIITNAKINLGSDAIGRSYVGGIAGLASGNISYVANLGKIDGGIHNFDNLAINSNFYVGGIVGTNSNNINISYSINKGEIIGVGSNNTNYQSSGINNYIGGIIGEANNITLSGNTFKYLTNEGDIDSNSFSGKQGSISKAFVGGIFGSVKGYGFKLSETINNETVVKNGRYENKGDIKGGYLNTYSYLYAAGIAVMNTDKSDASISYMTNSGGYNINNFNYQVINNYIYYAATVIDNTNTGITLSRAYNTKSFDFSGNFFSINNNVSQNEIKIAPFYTSVNNHPSKLHYAENKGNLTVGSTTSNTTVNAKLKISNITQSSFIDFINVINSGNINVYRLENTSSDIYVSGITWIIPYLNNRSYKMENVLNEGKITTAGILSNTTINSITGEGYNQANFSSTLTPRNLYVAGLVNLNVGEITNSYNMGDITSKYSSSVSDITGTANTYVGGIVTFNYNLIQDVANSGLIEYTNSNSNSEIRTAGNPIPGNFSNASVFGGITIAYRGGITLGGIAAGLGNTEGTELTGFGKDANLTANILDTANNGDIYGKTKGYVRSAGILGIALGVELASGTHNNNSNANQITPGPFARSIIGSGDTIADAMLSNGLNFGNIFAVSETIAAYPGALGTGNNDGAANTQRPGIHSSAGGVIAYGLTKMKRMLNHGVVTATDVAGGVVGATYILGDSNTNGIDTFVDIDTAVHYGKVKAIKLSGASSFTYNPNDEFNPNNLSNHQYYYQDGDTSFIFAANQNYDLARYPGRKRGFGGIFGRMQRGINGNMRSSNFTNIMNMDPNVDLIGRADQQQPGSIIRFRFYTGPEDGYYTARENDTTAMAVVGWLNQLTEVYTYKFAPTITFSIRRTGSGSNINYHVRGNIVIENGNGTNYQTFRRNKKDASSSTTGNETVTASRTINFAETTSRSISSGTTSNSYNATYDISQYGITPAEIQSFFSGTGNQTQTVTLYDFNIDERVSQNRKSTFDVQVTNTTNNSNNYIRYHIERISDDINDLGATYIFDPNFSLMDPENAEYIYNANKDVIANKFQDGNEFEKPDGGMYVLASTEGREKGAVLPSNIKVNKLFRLDESLFKYLDLDDEFLSDVVESGDPGSSVENLISAYKDLFQLSFNDKSLILPKDDEPNLGDITLYDPTGNSPILSGGIIDNNPDNPTITFNVAGNAFSGNNFSYEVLSASLSESAVIAKNGIDHNNFNDFNNAYLNENSNIIKEPSLKWSYTGSVNQDSQTTFPLTVYSEISANDIGLLNRYQTTYTIVLNRLSSNLSVSTNIRIDNNQANYQTTNNVHTVTDRIMSPNGYLEAIFTENNHIPNNHLMTLDGLYLNNEKIDSDYYEYMINPKSSNEFGFRIDLSDELVSGIYEVRYSYYESSTKYSIIFEKGSSDYYDIKDLEYDEFSNDLLGNELTFNQDGSNDFNTFVRFGYIFEDVTKEGITLDIEPIKEDALDYPNYLNDLLYYRLSYNGLVLIDNIKVAPFSEIISATMKYQYISDGRKEYVITYYLASENDLGNNTYNEINHTILERHIDKMLIYKDDNLQTNNNLTVTREALETRIDIDFNFIDSILNEDVTLNVLKNNNQFNYNDNEIDYETSFYFNLSIFADLEVGLKEYHFLLNREDNVTYDLGSIYIEKLLGVSAYLLDIHFQIDSEITLIYPDISAVDNELNVLSNYDTRLYFDGIDYDDSDLNNHKYYRIDGKVSDILLDYYEPKFSLPFGATIERFDGTNWVSELSTNFEGEDDFDTIVLYKITSEDGLEEVYYYITVFDIKYNLTLKFSIYYEFEDGTVIKADSSNSPIKNKVVLISIKNLKLNDSFDPHNSDYDPENYIYPDIVDYIDGVNNQSSLYYFTSPDGDYVYRFGRNMTGAYNFSIIPPLYSGITNDNLVNGQRYMYTMYLKEPNIDDYDWHLPKYELPLLDDEGNFTGRYYYILSESPRPITREFAVLIKEKTAVKYWGLYDNTTSWDS